MVGVCSISQIIIFSVLVSHFVYCDGHCSKFSTAVKKPKYNGTAHRLCSDWKISNPWATFCGYLNEAKLMTHDLLANNYSKYYCPNATKLSDTSNVLYGRPDTCVRMDTYDLVKMLNPTNDNMQNEYVKEAYKILVKIIQILQRVVYDESPANNDTPIRNITTKRKLERLDYKVKHSSCYMQSLSQNKFVNDSYVNDDRCSSCCEPTETCEDDQFKYFNETLHAIDLLLKNKQCEVLGLKSPPT